MQYADFFTASLASKQSYLCIGIDPDPGKLPAGFTGDADGVFRFVREIIQTTADLTPAYKFNLAFFELWGWRGWQILEKLLSEVPDNILLVGDAKRGDIGNSSRFYARALQSQLPFRAVTLSPYLGSESILPFIEDDQKGAFVLCVTSNPSGREIQDHGGEFPVYLKVAELVRTLNSRRNLGLVMGATKPEQLLDVRRMFPEIPFLIPGIGSQGGEVAAAVNACRQCGLGLINISRAILFPKGGTFPENVRQAAIEYQQLFNPRGET